MSSDERGFGPGFEKDVAAILATADRGLMYPREVRENLAKAGMIIYEHVEMPTVEPPSPIADVPEEMFDDFEEGIDNIGTGEEDVSE